MGGRKSKRAQAVAKAKPKIEARALEAGAEVSAETGAEAEVKVPAWVQAKAPAKAPTKTSAASIKRSSKKRKKRARAPLIMPSPAEAQRALTEELTVTVDDAAVLLKLSRHYAYAMVKKGEIPSIRFGRCIRVPAAALRAMLQIEAREAAE